MKKIHSEQQRINKERKPKSLRPKIIQGLTTFYQVVDMIIAMEHVASFFKDVKATQEIGTLIPKETSKTIGQVQSASSKWIAVRHLLGGHIDIKTIESACERHNFYGSLLSDDLEADISVYNLLILEAAINGARSKSDIFGRDIDFLVFGIPSELELIVNKLNADWKSAFELFPQIIKQIYEIGKQEKIEATLPSERTGLLDWSN